MFAVDNFGIEYPNLLTFNEAKKLLSIGRSTMYNLLHGDEIKYIRIGRDFKIPKTSVIDYLNNKAAE